MKRFQMFIQHDLYDRLLELATKQKLSMAEIIRRAIEAYIK